MVIVRFTEPTKLAIDRERIPQSRWAWIRFVTDRFSSRIIPVRKSRRGQVLVLPQPGAQLILYSVILPSKCSLSTFASARDFLEDIDGLAEEYRQLGLLVQPPMQPNQRSGTATNCLLDYPYYPVRLWHLQHRSRRFRLFVQARLVLLAHLVLLRDRG